MANYNNETGSIADLDGKTFALTFTSKLNETFTTIPIVFASTASGTGDVDMRNDVQLALLSLPNKVIDGVTVSLSEVNTGVQNPQGSYGTTEFNTKYRDIDDFNVDYDISGADVDVDKVVGGVDDDVDDVDVGP